MILGFDIDNVISDLDRTFWTEFLKEDKNKRNAGIINKQAKHITEGMLDWSDEEIILFLKENMDRMSLSFRVRKNAKKVLSKLKSEGHKIYLITHRNISMFSNPLAITMNWLNKHKIPFDKLIFTKSNDKSSECLENKVQIMFDDIGQNCKYCQDKGIESYLVKTRYNKNFSCGVPIVSSWNKIYELIRSKDEINK